ncbi:MAG: LapA family protein [Rhizobiales bacterium]|nr:LapA family protein [Hyphomicrobiales bacterium]MBI3673372.1 LapA family protein [Hyphomicrobiales bacterium]
MTIRKFINWIVGLPVAVLAVVFAVANRQWVVVSFDPLSRDGPRAFINMPLWVLFFCGIFVGLLAGWIAAWISQGKHRKAARQARIELIRAHEEHEKLKRETRARAVASAGDAAS